MIQVTREQHVCLPEVQDELTRAGGLNQFGEPNFRAVWSYSRLGWMGGRWVDRDTNGNVLSECFQLRQVPKYLPETWNRWVIESYRPPEFYGSRWLWEFQTRLSEDGKTIPALGPYPSRGDYEHSLTVEKACEKCLADARAGDPKAISNCSYWQFVQLTPFVAHKIALMIMRSREVTALEQREAIVSQIKREEQLEDFATDEILAQAAEYEIPKSRQDYLERFMVPAIERKLARDMKRRHQLSPETRKILDRGRSSAISLPN